MLKDVVIAPNVFLSWIFRNNNPVTKKRGIKIDGCTLICILHLYL